MATGSANTFARGRRRVRRAGIGGPVGAVRRGRGERGAGKDRGSGGGAGCVPARLEVVSDRSGHRATRTRRLSPHTCAGRSPMARRTRWCTAVRHSRKAENDEMAGSGPRATTSLPRAGPAPAAGPPPGPPRLSAFAGRRRLWDSNPRSRDTGSAVFKTAALVHYAKPPWGRHHDSGSWEGWSQGFSVAGGPEGEGTLPLPSSACPIRPMIRQVPPISSRTSPRSVRRSRPGRATPGSSSERSSSWRWSPSWRSRSR